MTRYRFTHIHGTLSRRRARWLRRQAVAILVLAAVFGISGAGCYMMAGGR